jgi:hypothetical protein
MLLPCIPITDVELGNEAKGDVAMRPRSPASLYVSHRSHTPSSDESQRIWRIAEKTAW